jgi:hypothetical protein
MMSQSGSKSEKRRVTIVRARAAGQKEEKKVMRVYKFLCEGAVAGVVKQTHE